MTGTRSKSKPDRSSATPAANPHKVSRKAEIVFGTFYLLSALAVRLLPPTRWGLLPNLLAAYQTRRPTDKYRAFGQAVRAVLGDELDDGAIKRLCAQHGAHAHQRHLVVAALRRRQGWNPSITLIGRERLEAALARGRGAILWFDGFFHSAIIGKRAFAEAGHAMWHLSAQGHGILNTPLAELFLNPKVIEVELRYLAGRIVFDPTATITATRRMIEILEGNGIVSLINNAYIGKLLLSPFGIGMMLPMARTPLNLAASRGVALLPVSVIEVEPFARYEVTVGPDLAAPAVAGSIDPIRARAKAYASYLLPLAKAHPAQWGGWGIMRRG